jgi:uncharacterized protein (TIGR02246 family)
MTIRTLIAMTLTTALFATGCQKKEEEKAAEEAAKAEAPAVDLAAEEQAIRNRSSEWMNYMNAKDSASVLNAVYSPDAVTVFGGNVSKGKEANQKALEEHAKKNPDAIFSWSSDSVKVAASGDMAVEKGNYYYDPDGDGRKSQSSGTYVTVWEKVDGEWRVTTDVAVEKSAEDEKPAEEPAA